MTPKDLTKKLSYEELGKEIINLSNSIIKNLEKYPKYYEEEFKKLQEIGNSYINAHGNLKINQTIKLRNMLSVAYMQLETSMQYTSLKPFRKFRDDPKFNKEVEEEVAKIKTKRKWKLF